MFLRQSSSGLISKRDNPKGMKVPVLWLSFVSVWAGTGKVICLAWDLVTHTPYSKMAANKLFFCLHVY